MIASERFWQKVDMNGPEHPTLGRCFIWRGSINEKGYGKFWVGGKHVKAHRFSYGSRPGDPELDHLCRNRACVRPTHLEPVTHAENCARGEIGAHLSSRESCPKGHTYDEQNTYKRPNGGRGCKACRLQSSRDYRARKAA